MKTVQHVSQTKIEALVSMRNLERPMTFEQFQATRRQCDDLGTVLDDSRWQGEPAARGNLYLGALYIDEVMPHWPDDAKAKGKWHLIIERDEWITDDLESLERQLYDFAISAGYEAA